MKTSIDEQIAKLTEEQKNKIPLIYKIRLAITLAVFATMILFMINCNDILSDFTLDKQITDALFKKFIAVITISFAFVGVVFLFIKIKFPYFSKKAYKYLKEL